MAGWSIRRKLGLLVTIPLVVLLVGGGVLVTSLTGAYRDAHTTRVDAEALMPALLTARALHLEFDAPAAVAAKPADLKAARAETDKEISLLEPHLRDLAKRTSAKSASVLPQIAQALIGQLDTVGNGRKRVDALVQSGTFTSTDPKRVIVGEDQVVSATTTLLDTMQNFIASVTGDLAITSPDSTVAANSAFVTAVTSLALNASNERTLFNKVFAGKIELNQDKFTALESLIAQQDQAIGNAQIVANPREAQELSALSNLDQQLNDWRRTLRAQFSDPTANLGSSAAFNRFSLGRIVSIEKTDTEAAQATLAGSQDTETSALFRVALVAGAVVLTLILVSALLATIARTITTPLRRLRAGAVEVASVQLPAAVARIEQDGVGADVSLPPVLPADANAGPEALEVAHAVDDLGAEAVRLATAQVRLRRALDEAFVSMSRRSQSMVEKQLAIIDSLESQEQDPDQLRNLFRLDHLAARMRRYNDNLLVLAGSAVRTRATAPVKIAELFRAATSEMEQYERVRLQPVSGASIAGTVAGELVHLLAELLDNAAMYSPPSSAIVLSAAFTADGGLQIEVLDAGVGISPGELDRLNGRLSQPEAIDTQVPSRMGLFVVARLARRGTFGVMLQARPDASGTIALVRVPASLVIGAPGSTGEIPMPANANLRPLTPAAGNPRVQQPPSSQFAAYHGSGSQPAERQPQRQPERQPERQQPAPTFGASTFAVPAAPAPAATAAAAAAQAAAGVRSVADRDENGNAALPRRRRSTTGGPNAGLPAEAIAAAANPPTGLFTPTVPVTPSPAGQDPRERQHATGGFNRGPVQPHPETTPNGIPNLPPIHYPGQQQPINQPYEQPYEDRQPAENRQPQESQSGQQISRYDANHFDTPAAGISGLPGLAHPIRRGLGTGEMRTSSGRQGGENTGGFQDPLSASTGQFRTAPNQALPAGPQDRSGAAGWNDDDLPTELAARAAAAAAYRPVDPSAPMIGDDVRPDFNDPTPIFDQISVWFTSEPAPSSNSGEDRVIDLREQDNRRQSSRWASLGDQRWLATNARAAAAPETEGATDQGLPKRRPGANLLPSAAGQAAPPAPPVSRPAARGASRYGDRSGSGTDSNQNAQDAAIVRGRLGSYQRGLANARRARKQPAPAPAFDPVGASLFTANSEVGDDSSRPSGEQGGDQ
jgi:signal transduction histidine kinase